MIVRLFRSEMSGRGLPDAPDIPSSVLLAGRPAVLPPSSLPFDAAAYADATLRDRVARLRTWANLERGGQFVVTETGHFIHAEAPDVVIGAIRHLTELIAGDR